MKMIDLYHNDCLKQMRQMKDCSVDSIVTDPPYGFSFMGKKWDYDVPSQEIWEECLRVLKPGGYLLAFSGSRTYHRMAVRIEDAGFEIRDQIMWIYGSGFPKSLDVAKAIEGKLTHGSSNTKDFHQLKGDRESGRIGFTKSNFEHQSRPNDYTGAHDIIRNVEYTTAEAKEWDGWGTALKPAHEPIVMARKPLNEKTVAENVLEWGTGSINIDDSRIGTNELKYIQKDENLSTGFAGHKEGRWDKHKETSKHVDYVPSEKGRFPSNVIIDEDASKIMDEQSGITNRALKRPPTNPSFRDAGKQSKENIGIDKLSFGQTKNIKRIPNNITNNTYIDQSGASRFFYTPKASQHDRNEGLEDFETKQTTGGGGGVGDYLTDVNSASGKFGSEKAPAKNIHPTVKPTDLMLYLVRLVTPKNGITLDPFMGSGSTGKACVRGGFAFIGIELEEEYYNIAKARIDYEMKNPYIEKYKQRKPQAQKTLDDFLA